MLKFLICVAALLALGFCKAKRTNKSFEILIAPPSEIVVELGETLSVVCAAHGNDMIDPVVYWVKNITAKHDRPGERIRVSGIGKSILYVEKVEAKDIDSYKCVIEDKCTGDKEEIWVDVVVPDRTCEDVYGVGPVVYGASWHYKNWTAAVQDCLDKGLEIALPTSDEENAVLLANILKSYDSHPNAQKFAHENWLWIGAHDMTHEGQWTSVVTEELLLDVYAERKLPWGKGQPDNRLGPNNKFPEDQDVAGIHRGSGKWDDSFEHYNRPYVCLCPPQ